MARGRRFNYHIDGLIANFRNIPRRNRFLKSNTLDISSVITRLEQKYKIITEKLPQQALMEQWKDIVGSKNAHRCSPQKITPTGILKISVGNAAVKSELTFQKLAILRKIRLIPECTKIIDVLFVSG